jgi:hypothetical protein
MGDAFLLETMVARNTFNPLSQNNLKKNWENLVIIKIFWGEWVMHISFKFLSITLPDVSLCLIEKTFYIKT